LPLCAGRSLVQQDARRAAALGALRATAYAANEARANYRTFHHRSSCCGRHRGARRIPAEALNSTRVLSIWPRAARRRHWVTPKLVGRLALAVRSGATLDKLMALRGQIALADHYTREIDETSSCATRR